MMAEECSEQIESERGVDMESEKIVGAVGAGKKRTAVILSEIALQQV